MVQQNKEYQIWGESGQFYGDTTIAPQVHAMAREVLPNPVSQAEIKSMLGGQ